MPTTADPSQHSGNPAGAGYLTLSSCRPSTPEPSQDGYGGWSQGDTPPRFWNLTRASESRTQAAVDAPCGTTELDRDDCPLLRRTMPDFPLDNLYDVIHFRDGEEERGLLAFVTHWRTLASRQRAGARPSSVEKETEYLLMMLTCAIPHLAQELAAHRAESQQEILTAMRNIIDGIGKFGEIMSADN
ncbi:hypothetical protein C8Q76DRAFT_795157 [Earliella scabrosa]|nr:hypothetical protein C8Q76DRAFT_795157 [Earliella scabrosa]